MRLTRTTNPASEPVSLQEVKDYLRIDHVDEDALLGALIVTAREVCEAYLNRSLITQTWTMFLDGFPGSLNEPWWDGVRVGSIEELSGGESEIPLFKGPVQAVASITAYDDADAATVASASTYYVSTSLDGFVSLRKGAVWPTALRVREAVKVIYSTGFGDSWNDVPYSIRQGICAHVGALYGCRDGEVAIPKVSAALWRAYKRTEI